MNEKSKILEDLYNQAETKAQSDSLFEQLMEIDLRYLRMGNVGHGAMKEVFRTEDRKTGRMVAMALLKNPDEPKAVESFLREARINAQLQHPHIVPVYEIDIDEQQRPYFTMKLIPGSSLKQILDELKEGKEDATKKYPLTNLLDIYLKVCEAIAYAHSQGICHLDIKPDNIRVSSYGDVMVCDWGLAGFIGEQIINSHEKAEDSTFAHYESRYMTLEGQVKGTPGYMAPEQASGKREEKDQRTDIFALGSILYEILTRCEAIEGETVEEVLKNTCTESISPPSLRHPDVHIPESLEAICMKSLKISPEERYNEVDEIIEEIEAYRMGFATKAEKPSLLKQLNLFYRRNQTFCLVVLFLVIILITITVSFIKNIKDQEQVALKALGALRKQQQLTSETLLKLSNERDFRKKIGQESAITYATKAGQAFKKQNKQEALELAEIALALDDQNVSAYSTLAKVKMANGDFEGAWNIYETEPELEEDVRLQIFCKKVIDLKSKEQLNYQSVYTLLKTHVSSNRTPFINLILKPYLEPFDEVKLLETRLSWLLKSENNLDSINFGLKHQNGKYYADISNNVKLSKIYFLRLLPLAELNISNTAMYDARLLIVMHIEILHIRNMKFSSLDFLNRMPQLKKVYLTKSAFGKKILTRVSKDIEIIETESTPTQP